MFDRVQLKKEAKEKIANGRWAKVFGVQLLAGLLMMAIMIVAMFLFAGAAATNSVTGVVIGMLIMLAAAILFIPSILYGLEYYYQNTWRGTSNGFSDVMIGFKRFGLSVRSYWWMYLWIVIWMLPFFIVMSFITTSAIGSMYVVSTTYGMDPTYMMQGMSSSAALTGGLGALFWIVYIATLIVIINRGMAYSQMYYVVTEHPELGAQKGLNISKQMMKGHKWELIVVFLSFIPWMLLQFLPMYLGVIIGAVGLAASNSNTMFAVFSIIGVIGSLLISMYVGPYMSITIAGYYDKIKQISLDQNIVTPEDFNETREATFNQGSVQEEIKFVPPDLK